MKDCLLDESKSCRQAKELCGLGLNCERQWCWVLLQSESKFRATSTALFIKVSHVAMNNM